jgi:hypothetical protein
MCNINCLTIIFLHLIISRETISASHGDVVKLVRVCELKSLILDDVVTLLQHLHAIDS